MLSTSVTAGQLGHIEDHETIASRLNSIFDDEGGFVGDTPTLIHPAGLARWAKARGEALFRQVSLAVLGDSVVVGANANDSSASTASDQLIWAQRGWVAQLRSRLEVIFGTVGEGWITFGSDEGRWVYAGTTSASPAGPLTLGRQVNATGNATGTFRFTDLDVIVYHSTGVSSPRVLVDAADKTPTLLTATQAALAVGATDWSNRANTTLVHSTDSSEDILEATSAASGDMAFQTPTGTSGRACSAGDSFLVTAELRSAAQSRSWRVGAGFYDSSGATISELSTTNQTSTVGSWQHVAAIITAPASSAFANAIVRVEGAGSAEQHDVKRVRLTPLQSKFSGSAGVTFYRFTISGLSDADHTLVIGAGSTGNLFVSGVMARRDTTDGILVHRIGKSGATTEDLVGANYIAATAANMLSSLHAMESPDLAVMAFGANDIPNQLSDSITPTSFKANLKVITDRVASDGGCSLLVAGPRYATEVSGGSTQAEFYAKMRELAEEDTHVAFLDLAEMWRDNSTANTAGFMDNANLGIHPTLAGHGDYALAIFDAITRPISLPSS